MGKSRQMGPTNWAACTDDNAVYMVPGTTMEIPRFASVSSAAIQGARHPVESDLLAKGKRWCQAPGFGQGVRHPVGTVCGAGNVYPRLSV